MIKKIIFCLILVLSISKVISADNEVIAGFDKDKDLPVLNEELRKLRYDLDNITAIIIENRTSDPSSPKTGQIWYRTDL